MGLGYRVPFGTGAVDLHGGFDWGKFDEAKVNANGSDAGGTIDPAGQATHWALNLGVAYRFGSR